MKIRTLVATTALAIAATSPAMAVPIPNGTVSTADLFVPTINITTAPATYTVTMGSTVNTIGTAGFANVTGRSGIENGTLQFSSTVGTTIAETVGSLFIFNSPTQTYAFSVSSVRTDTFSSSPQTSAMALYLLGSTTSTGFDATPTSLTLNFNSTGGSPFAVSQTLAIPPSGGTAIPEPASMALLGMGLIAVGTINRRRRAKPSNSHRGDPFSLRRTGEETAVRPPSMTSWIPLMLRA